MRPNTEIPTMGNKSKQNPKTARIVILPELTPDGKARAFHRSWRMARDVANARLPRAFNGSTWHGLAPRRETEFGGLVVDEKGHAKRVTIGSLIHSGGTLRHSPAPKLEVNTSPQPWQKLAKRTHAGWNDRRLAREQRKSNAINISYIRDGAL